jgi:hypothetical protein
MNAVQHHVPDLERDTDAARVVAALRRTGPATLTDLRAEPEIGTWETDRVQAAVTAAWTRTLIFVDAHDRLVAL